MVPSAIFWSLNHVVLSTFPIEHRVPLHFLAVLLRHGGAGLVDLHLLWPSLRRQMCGLMIQQDIFGLVDPLRLALSAKGDVRANVAPDASILSSSSTSCGSLASVTPSPRMDKGSHHDVRSIVAFV